MKDARGHGSNKTNGISVINPNGGNIAKAIAQRNAQFGAQFGAVKSGATPVANNTDAAAQLASGPKSAPAPVHDSMSASETAHRMALGYSKGGLSLGQRYSAEMAKRRAASLERLPSN
jgi:hypothetical protein